MHKTFIQNFLLSILLVVLLCMEFSPLVTVYAATMRFYNYTTGSNVTYTGTQVSYKYNNRTIPLTYPGIIISGMALADYEELFVKEIGLQGQVNGNVITLTDGTTVLELTLGSKNAVINGKKSTMPVAPVKLGFDADIKYYVPTNFVADTFGFSYVWVDKDRTAKITKTLHLSINEQEVDYNSSFYHISYEGQPVSLELPVLYYNGLVMVPAEAVFKAAGCQYEQTEETILISKGDIFINFDLNSKNAFINEKKVIVGTMPLHIRDLDTQKEYYYISLEFAADFLGFELSYDENKFRYNLQETEITGNAVLHPLVATPTPTVMPTITPIVTPEPVSEQTYVFVEQEPKNYYFDWIAPEEVIAEPEYRYITRVTGYSLEQADVVELYGVSCSDINDFIDNGLLVIELKNILTTMDTKYYADYSNECLMYAILTGLHNNTKLLLMLQPEVTWHFVEREDKTQIYFIHNETNLEELLSLTTPTPLPTITITPTPFPEPNSIYSEDVLILPVPETITTSQIQDADNYLERQFEIILLGNHTEFYQTHFVINPYYLVEDYFISYDGITDTTIITFATKTICSYQYVLKDDYIAVTIGRPSEMYSKIIVLDAGHGGADPGANKGGYREKDLNFTILNNYTGELFKNSDIKVYFTRETDVLIDLYDRAAFASEVGADLFISLHMNANNSTSINGTEVFYSTDNNKITSTGLNSYTLAKHMAAKISSAISTKNRGASKAEFVVVKYNTVPAVLIELGFMTNKSELAKLTNITYQKKAAEAIYHSVLEIFEQYPTGR